MHAPKEFASTQFRLHPAAFLAGTVVVVLVSQMLSGNTYLMLLPSSRLLVLALLAVFFILALLARVLSRTLLSRLDLHLPTVMLWFHPFLLTILTFLLALGLLVVWPS